MVRTALEALGLYAALAVVPCLPRAGVVGLARLLGRAAFVLSPGLRRVALANLDVAYGDTLTGEAKQRVARESFRSVALVALDFFWFSRFTERRLARYVTFDPSFDAYFEAAPVIAVTGHLGNWEVLGLATAARGGLLVSVAAPLGRTADRVITRLRERTGQRVVMKRGAVRALLAELRRKGRVGILMDQNTLPRDGGAFADFFGLPVLVSKSVGALAARTGADVCLAFCLPEGRRYRACAVPLGQGGDGPGVPGEMTRAMLDGMQRMIREHPGKWLWMYKRWKYVPPGRDRHGYPFYARGFREREGSAGTAANERETGEKR